MRDLASDEDCFVRESMGTYRVDVGSVMFCRVARLGSTHIIVTLVTPTPAALPPETGYLIKGALRQSRGC